MKARDKRRRRQARLARRREEAARLASAPASCVESLKKMFAARRTTRGSNKKQQERAARPNHRARAKLVRAIGRAFEGYREQIRRHITIGLYGTPEQQADLGAEFWEIARQIEEKRAARLGP